MPQKFPVRGTNIPSPFLHTLYDEMNMKKVNVKFCTAKTVKPDYRDRMTAQEANCDGIITSSTPTLKVTGETVIDGKKYITLTV